MRQSCLFPMTSANGTSWSSPASLGDWTGGPAAQLPYCPNRSEMEWTLRPKQFVLVPSPGPKRHNFDVWASYLRLSGNSRHYPMLEIEGPLNFPDRDCR